MQPRTSLGDSACTRRVTRDTYHPPTRDLAEYVARALFTFGFPGEVDDSWTVCMDHVKGPLKKARSCSDAMPMVCDTVTAAAIYLKACMRDGTCRTKAAFASGTPRSTFFVSSSLGALEIFDTFKGEMGQMATLHKSFANTMVAMKGSYTAAILAPWMRRHPTGPTKSKTAMATQRTATQRTATQRMTRKK